MWFIKHTKTGEILNIKDEETTVGRLGTSIIFKNDESISRKHCTFLMRHNELKVIDNGAKYGTSVNEKNNKITKEPLLLNDGDKIHFGCFHNIWTVHFKEEAVVSTIKRKHNEDQATNENSLSISNVSKKPKQNPMSTKIGDMFDFIIESSDDEFPANTGRSIRQRKNIIIDSDEILPSTSKEPAVDKKKDGEPKNVTQKATKDSIRSQSILDIDSDEDIFSTKPTKEDSTSKISFVDEDLFDFDIPLRKVNTLKRSSDDLEEGGSSKKVYRTLKTKRNCDLHDISELSASKVITSTQNTTKSSNKASPLPSLNSRKREIDEDPFDFDIPEKHQLKRVKKNNKNVEQEKSEPIPSTSTASNKKALPFAFKTTHLTNKEIFSSVKYDVDETGAWLSTKVSNMNIKVKDEFQDQSDNSMASSLEQRCNYSVNAVRKSIKLDSSLNSKTFIKQKFDESDQTVQMRKMSVKDMNSCYSVDESNSSWT